MADVGGRSGRGRTAADRRRMGGRFADGRGDRRVRAAERVRRARSRGAAAVGRSGLQPAAGDPRRRRGAPLRGGVHRATTGGHDRCGVRRRCRGGGRRPRYGCGGCWRASGQPGENGPRASHTTVPAAAAASTDGAALLVATATITRTTSTDREREQLVHRPGHPGDADFVAHGHRLTIARKQGFGQPKHRIRMTHFRSRAKLVDMPLSGEYEPSTSDWARENAEKIHGVRRHRRHRA